MFILYSIILGILIGYASGGGLKWLGKKTLRKTWIAFISFLIQILIFADIPYIKSLPGTAIVVFHFLSYVGLIWFIVINVKIPGIPVIGLGIFANALVIFLNGGYMPTIAENMKNTSVAKYAQAIAQGSAVHNSSQISPHTLLPWLGDIFYLPSWVPFSNVFSVGDIIIAFGIILYFTVNMHPLAEGKRKTK